MPYLWRKQDELLWRTQSTPKIRRVLRFFKQMHYHLDVCVPEIEARIELLEYLLFERVSMKETVH